MAPADADRSGGRSARHRRGRSPPDAEMAAWLASFRASLAHYDLAFPETLTLAVPPEALLGVDGIAASQR